MHQIPAHSHPMLGIDQPRHIASNPQGEHHSQFAVNHILHRTDSPRTCSLQRRRRRPVGGSQPHTNFQPYLCVDFIISLFGIYPSPT